VVRRIALVGLLLASAQVRAGEIPGMERPIQLLFVADVPSQIPLFGVTGTWRRGSA
jgi:hypothetical protein